VKERQEEEEFITDIAWRWQLAMPRISSRPSQGENRLCYSGDELLNIQFPIVLSAVSVTGDFLSRHFTFTLEIYRRG
jgi:hypothetical protein